MLGRYLTSPLLTFDSIVSKSFRSNERNNVNLLLQLQPDPASVPTGRLFYKGDLNALIPLDGSSGHGISTLASRNWQLHFTPQIQEVIVSDEDNKTWESCKRFLSAYGFGSDEGDKILGKAFGLIHSPYWGEEREQQVPKPDLVSEILVYLKELGLSDDDLCKLVKKFPEVLGCSLESELKANVQILEKEWGIRGKTLKNLLLRNPRVLGYNIDCKGDCKAQCTRCWVRF